MSIRIKVSKILLKFTDNQDVIEVKGGTIGECIDELTRQFPDIKEPLFDKNGIFRAMINISGSTGLIQDLSKPVTDGDELQLLLIVGGG